MLDTPDRQRRRLVIDGGTHTIVDPSTCESHFPYVAVMGLTRCLVAEPGRMLLIGVGGGSLVKAPPTPLESPTAPVPPGRE